MALIERCGEADGELVDGGKFVRFVRLVPASIDVVWAYLTERDKLARWIGPGRIEPRIGGAVDMRDGEIVGEVEEWAPPHRLSYTWRVAAFPGATTRLTSKVTFHLEELRDGVRLTLTHGVIIDGFHALSLGGWHALLRALADSTAGKVVTGMQQDVARLRALYAAKYGEALAWGTPEHGGAAVRFTRFFDAPIERVWAYVLDPALRAQWFYGGTIEARVGGQVAMSGAVLGEVTEFRPPRVLAFTWRHPTEKGWQSASSDVRIELSSAGPGTILTLVHSRMVGADRTENSIGWHAHLEALVAVVAGRAAPVLRDVEARVKEAYRLLYE